MRINNISGGYPGGFFLRDISLTLKEGKVYALLGLNGSGKTTLLKLICGLLKAQSGDVLVDSVDILSLSDNERAKIVSYIPQYSRIYYDTSVIDVVLMGVTPYLSLFETPGKKHIDKAYGFLKELGIERLANENYKTLSGGLKQIAIIARALLQNGRYMIFDEPDSSLDLQNRHKLMRKITDISYKFQKACLISMHDPEYALNYCDSIFLLNKGKIIKIDLKNEKKDTIEEKLFQVYGNVEIIRYKNKYLLYHNG